MNAEQARCAAVRALDILDTPPESGFDRIAVLAAELCGTPKAAISLIDVDRQWFKARVGDLPPETPRDIAFCDHTIRRSAGDPLRIEDASLDPRFRDNPLVTAQDGMRFYLGAPMVDRAGVALGALCVIDSRPRPDIGSDHMLRLQMLADMAVEQLELRGAARRLIESQRVLSLAESLVGVGHWSLDRTGKVTWSDEVYRIHGMDPASFDPNLQGALDFYHADDRSKAADAVARAFAEKSGFDFELRILRPDGKLCRVISRAVCELDTHGEVDRLFGVFQDVTAQHTLLEQVSAERERYRLLTQNATDVIATYTPRGVFTYLSPSIQALVGRSAEELVGRRTYDVIHTADHARVTEEFGTLLASGQASSRIEYRIVMPDDTSRWVEAHPSPVFGLDGELTGFQDVVRDVSVRRAAQEKALEQAERAEAALTSARKSEKRYRLLADNANDMISTTALDSTVLFVTPGVKRVLGYAPEEIVGRKTLELTHPDDLPAVKALFKGLFASDGDAMPTPYQFRGRRKDGSWAWLEGQPRVQRDASGRPTVFQDVVRDITARKRLETELGQAKIAAEAASQAKTDFLANMSHELRTPLNSIIGFTNVLVRDERLHPEHRNHLKRIEEAGQGLLTVVNDVLDFSRIESRGVQLAVRAFSPVRLLEALAALMHPTASDKGLSLVVDYPLDRETQVMGDPDRLRQVLMNLLSNAVKFTERGAVRLALQTRRRDGVVELAFQVSDTGIGISANQIDSLFQRFEQADGSISRRFGGTGLGLAISKRLVSAMDGDIEVSSEPGYGATFTVRLALPCAKPGAGAGVGTAAGTERQPAAPFSPQPGELSAVRVLVADDVPVNQELVRLMLAPLGCEVVVVNDGAQAVDAIELQSFDLVLMDMQMPVMDGLEATRIIRRIGGAAARTPIVALTANVLPEQVERCRRAGMDDHVAKPFVSTDLQSMVLKWTEGRVRPEQGGSANPVLDDLIAQVGRAPVEGLLKSLALEMKKVLQTPASAEPQALARLAHSLRGAAGSLGYADAAAACQAVETAHRNGEPAVAAMKTLQASCRIACQAMERRPAA